MDFELFMIFVFIITIVSIVMGTIGGAVKRHIKLKERALELQHGAAANAAPAEVIAQFRKMEERLRVLERIATDKAGYGEQDQLSAEIEALRLSAPEAETAR